MTSWDWTGKRREWFKSASTHTGFHKNLAANLMANELKGFRDIFDAGCGLGLLSIALSFYADEVTAMDLNGDAIDSLKRDIESRDITNVTPLRGDCFQYRGRHDAAVFCFFRATDLHFRSFSCGRIIRVAAIGSRYLSADDGNGRHCRRDSLDRALERQDVTYSFRPLSLEFGQPLRDMEDARDFVRCQTPGAGREDISAYLENSLVETGDPEFPLYIPHLKEMGIYCIDTRR